MNRADFLRLAALTPLAKLFGWKEPEPEVSVASVWDFEDLDEPVEYTLTSTATTDNTIYVYMDPMDPRNGHFQTVVGEANVYFNQRRGRRA